MGPFRDESLFPLQEGAGEVPFRGDPQNHLGRGLVWELCCSFLLILRRDSYSAFLSGTSQEPGLPLFLPKLKDFLVLLFLLTGANLACTD